MSNEAGKQKHDRIFRHGFSVPLGARQFLERWLPAYLLNSTLLDWSTLDIRKVTGINEALTERNEDLIYRVRAAGYPVWFYVLLKHQTQPSRWMALRTMEYIVRAWQEYSTARNFRIPTPEIRFCPLRFPGFSASQHGGC